MLGMRTLRVATRAYASAAAPKAAAVASFPLPTHAKYDPELDPQLAGLDYPLLSSASRQLRSPKGYWDSQERANFDEPVPENEDLQSMWAPDVHRIAPFSAFSQLLTAFAGVSLFAAFVYLIAVPPKGLPRAYPHDGLVMALSGTTDPTFAARTTAENEVEE